MRVLLDILKTCFVSFLFIVFLQAIITNFKYIPITNPEVYPKLHFTGSEDVSPCSKYIRVKEEYIKSVNCTLASDKKLYDKFLANPGKLLKIPECNILELSSPDVYSGKRINYIRLRPSGGRVLGFYTYKTKQVFMVRQRVEDLRITWRHEVQHYVMDMLDVEDDHSEPVWSKCEAKYHTSSLITKILGNPDYKSLEENILTKFSRILDNLIGR